MKEEINFSEMLFNRDKRLLDCITNLQEELEEEKRIEQEDFKTIQNLEEENERLEALIELIYYKIQLNDEQQELLDSLLQGEDTNVKDKR